MMEALATCTAEICATLPGCQMAYVQSDEITIVLEDFSKPQTQAFFGGGVQKMTSVLASEMTARFGRHFPDRPIATFDARVWTVPNKAEACAALIWRQQDARRNAISMLCEHYFTPEQLHAVSLADRKDMLIEAGVDLESVDARFLHGQAIMRQTTRGDKSFIHKETGEELLATQVERTEWVTTPAPTFDVSDAGFLRQQITVDDPIVEVTDNQTEE